MRWPDGLDLSIGLGQAQCIKHIGRSKGVPWTHAPGVHILSFSYSFWQKIDKIIPIWELAHPPRVNPGSANET